MIFVRRCPFDEARLFCHDPPTARLDETAYLPQVDGPEAQAPRHIASAGSE